MKLASLRDLYIDELKDLYNAESQLLKALPKMSAGANSPDLKGEIDRHLEETKGHVERLDQIFAGLDASPKGKKCKAMEGLIAEGAEILEEDAHPAVKDAAIIAAAQRVEHYEMAGYGCVAAFAMVLGEEEAAALLNETLEEERNADAVLSDIAEGSVNGEANAARELVERM